ncbi:hypothetical protein ACFLVB_04445 [Chloroflexota bacterium]
MKTKFTTIWSISLVLVLLISMFGFAVPASAGSQKWTEVLVPRTGIYQLLESSNVTAVAVTEDGTIFAAVSENLSANTSAANSYQSLDYVYKSTNGGTEWTRSSTDIGAAIVDIAVSPDYANDNVVMVATKTLVYQSINGGGKFSQLGGAVTTDNITSIAIAPTFVEGTGEIAVGISDGAKGGDVKMWGYKDTLNWVTPDSKIFSGDAIDIVFSPNYPIDATILALSANASGLAIRTKVGTSNWDVTVNTPIVVSANATDGTIVSASLALPSNFNSTSSSKRRYYVGMNSASTDDRPKRVSNSTVLTLDIDNGGGDQPITSVAYSGDYSAGTLVLGQSNGDVFKLTNPQISSPTDHDWGEVKSATGDTAKLVLASDYATSNTMYVATSGTDSGLNVSTGSNFYQTGLIDTSAFTILDLAAASSSEILIATGGITDRKENVWKSSDGGATWVRTLTTELGDTPIVRLSPDYASDSTAYAAGVGGTAIKYSTNGGMKWSSRVASATIGVDLVVPDGFRLLNITATGFRESKNQGWTWGGNKAAAGVGTVTGAAYDAATGDIVVGDDAGKVFRTTDTGKNWDTTGALGGAVGIGAGTTIVAFDADYANSEQVFAADSASNDIFRAEPGDTEWDSIADDTVVLTIQKLISVSDGLYAITSNAGDGAWRSINPGVKASDVEMSLLDKDGTGAAQGGSLVSGSNILIVHTTTAVYTWTDTLTQATPALVSPEEGAISAQATLVDLDWNEVSGAKGYEVQLDTQDDFESLVALDASGITGDTVTTLRETGLQEGKMYFWRVRTRSGTNADSIYGPWSETRSFVTQITTAANTPTIQSPADRGTGYGGTDAPLMATFSWTPLRAATGYEFQLSRDAGFADMIADFSGATPLGNVTSYRVSEPLDYSTTYFWRVRAVASGTSTDWSGTVAFTTLAEPTEAAPPVVIEQVPAPVINIPPAPPAQEIVIPPAPAAPAPIAPSYIWAVIIIGAVLVIAVIVLIVRTRRVV